MNNDILKIQNKLDEIANEIEAKDEGQASLNKFLAFSKNRVLIWYTNRGKSSLDIIVQSDTVAGCGKSLNTEFITIKETSSSDKTKCWLHITLINLSDITTFMNLILDLIEHSNEALTGKEGIALVVERFSMWKNMLKHKGEEKGVAKGILGELLTIKRLLEQGVDADDVINGWGGPESTQQDFIMNNFWVETKTVGTNPSIVTINSLGQLDNPNTQGYLYVINVKACDNEEALSVERLYDEISSCLKDKGKIDALILFKTKMQEFEYNRFCLPGAFKCEIVKEQVYNVESDFPRLRNDYQRVGIKSVHYDLLLSVIEKWIVEEGVKIWQ